MKLTQLESALFRAYIHEKLLPDARRIVQESIDIHDRIKITRYVRMAQERRDAKNRQGP